jgi:hypothetical protein
MGVVFAWDNWNRKHVTKHGFNAADAKYIAGQSHVHFSCSCDACVPLGA